MAVQYQPPRHWLGYDSTPSWQFSRPRGPPVTCARPGAGIGTATRRFSTRPRRNQEQITGAFSLTSSDCVRPARKPVLMTEDGHHAHSLLVVAPPDRQDLCATAGVTSQRATATRDFRRQRRASACLTSTDAYRRGDGRATALSRRTYHSCHRRRKTGAAESTTFPWRRAQWTVS